MAHTKLNARDVARDTMRLNKLDGDPVRLLDGDHNGAPAWAVMWKDGEYAVVVYEDDPDSVCSVGAEHGRWREGT